MSKEYDAVHELVQFAHELKEYRPVAVGIVKDNNGRTLLVRSAKNFDNWGFPQGGIEQKEPPLDALFRELEEEIGAHKSLFKLEGYLGVEDLDAEEARKDKRGFSKGKRYFFFLLTIKDACIFDMFLNLDPNEISECRWTTEDEFENVLAKTRPQKRELVLRWATKKA